jgi:hypothetical protein
MLKAIYNPNQIPYIFSGMEPAPKIKTKFFDQLILEQPVQGDEDPILLVRFVYAGGTAVQTLAYRPAEIINKKGLKEVVPVILVLQDFNKRLYLGVTYVKFYAPEPEILPNQLKMFE